MIRVLAIVAATALLAVPAEAKRVMRAFTPVEKLARSEVVVVGKVTAVEKEMVNAPRHAGDTEKVPHKVVVIKIEKGLVGGDGVTHVKVGFIPPPPVDPNAPARPGRGGPAQQLDLKEGQEGVFFLTKQPGGGFYTVAPLMAPLDPKAGNYKAQLDQVTKAAAAFADPMKALKAEKAEDRFAAAAALVSKYRNVPDGAEVETVKVPAEESKLILKALAEADWKKTDPDVFYPTQAFYALGLTEKDGWKQPKPVPGTDFVDALKAGFTKWLDGPGKDYQVGKFVAKKK